jgi:hypothetical protein
LAGNWESFSQPLIKQLFNFFYHVLKSHTTETF